MVTNTKTDITFLIPVSVCLILHSNSHFIDWQNENAETEKKEGEMTKGMYKSTILVGLDGVNY